MKNKLIYLQPLLLAICVLITIEWPVDWAKPVYDSILYLYVILMALLSMLGLWSAGIVIVALLFLNKRYLKAIIILCLNIYISSFSDIYYFFDCRKTIVYIPQNIQDAKEKGAFICEYKQTNQVVLLDSIDISVDEAFASHLCFYDDKDILHAHPNLHKKDFVASLKNRERLDSIGERYRIYDGFKYTQLSAGKWTKIIEIDSITGALPENLVFRILHYERNEDSVIVDTCIDSICFVRVPERMTN